MKDTNFKDYFTSVANRYAKFRPSYPSSLVDALVGLCHKTDRAWDCCCGTGQLSVLLAERFNEVVATDASAAQIENAQANARVKYRLELAENCQLEDASVDMITVAQAAHWLDLEKFYVQVQRVAHPKTLIALIAYGGLQVEGMIDHHIQHFYHETLGRHWPPERKHVEDGYCNLPFPFTELALPPISMEANWRLDELIGYMSTWSATLLAKKSLGYDPLNALTIALSKEWTETESKKLVTWPLTIRAGFV